MHCPIRTAWRSEPKIVTWTSAPPIARLTIGVNGGSVIASTPISMIDVPWAWRGSSRRPTSEWQSRLSRCRCNGSKTVDDSEAIHAQLTKWDWWTRRKCWKSVLCNLNRAFRTRNQSTRTLDYRTKELSIIKNF